MTRMLMLIPVLAAVSVAGAQDHEALPWGDLEYMTGAGQGDPAVPVWARVGEPSASTGWFVSQVNAASGDVCVYGATAGSEFVLGGEGSGSPIVGSVKLRADAPTQAIVRLTWFDRWNRVSETQTVDVGAQWQAVELSISPDRPGPFELAVAPAGDLPVFADDFSIRCPEIAPNEQMEDPTPVGHRPVDLAPLQAWDGDAQDRTGTIALTLRMAEGEPLLPCAWGGVPLPKGELFRKEHARIQTPDGTPVRAQLDVLSRWHGDGSILALLVTVPSDAPGDLRLVYGPDVEAAAVEAAAQPEALALRPCVVGLDGTEYAGGREPEWIAEERSGPLARVMAYRGAVGPLMTETRITFFADSPRVLVSTTFINEGPALALSGLGVRVLRDGTAADLVVTPDGSIPLSGDGRLSWGIGPQRATETHYGVGEGAEPAGAVAVPSGDAAIAVAMRDFDENRPSGFTCTPDGLTAWAWPPEAGGFVMSQGMARTMDLIVDAQSADGAPHAFRTEDLPLLSADAEWICSTGVFNFLMPPDPETFPIFESTLGSMETLGRFAPEQKVRGSLYGLFDYGDAPGDGGWANLETEADHEIFLHFFRTLSRPHFDAARLAAEHYRDVDIDHRFGYCHIHCSQHTASGEGWSHAWIQGLRDLYLLTGDTRALAVLHEVGERLLSKEPGFQTGRDWTRAIDNLVDIYQVTGDQRYLDAAMAHVRVLGERQIPEESVCGAENGSWYHNRYQAGSAFTWYGCLAMAKLHQNVGGDELRDIFLREIELSLDVQTKGRMALNYYPDEEISEDKRAEEIGTYALGRGSVVFPPIGYAYELTGDEAWLRLGMDVLAHNLLNQRSSSDASATSFITAFLRQAKAAGFGPAEEREAFERAREFSWAQYPRELTNGGFEDGFLHWDVKKDPGTDFLAYQDPIVNVGYFVDADAIEGDRSLRIHSDNRLRNISVAGQTALPGAHRWRLTGWLKADETMTPGMTYALRSYDDDSRSSGRLTPTGETRDGWIEHEARFMTTARQVLTITLNNARGTGDVRFDGFALEDLGEVGKLLTENGVGHEGREPSESMIIRTGGTYLPDAPMVGDVEIDGPIPFTQGALTDGDDGYDYSRNPCSYAYWQSRESGELLFDFGRSYRIERVGLKVNLDASRRAHGTARIEVLPAEGEEPIAVIEEPGDGWNEFDGLSFEAQKLRLRLYAMEGRTYTTVAEVQVWGAAQ